MAIENMEITTNEHLLSPALPYGINNTETSVAETSETKQNLRRTIQNLRTA